MRAFRGGGEAAHLDLTAELVSRHRATLLAVTARLCWPSPRVSQSPLALDVTELRQVCEALGIDLTTVIRKWEGC
jgi:hypothetical protein